MTKGHGFGFGLAAFQLGIQLVVDHSRLNNAVEVLDLHFFYFVHFLHVKR